MLRTILKTTFPALLSVLLIGIVLFALLLPKLQTALVDQKISMVRSIAQSAWSILDALHARVDKGELTLEEAQGTAKSIVHSMRYDDEGRNYFWILDYGHVTLVHPYQPGHVGQDISWLTDITGKRFIAEMVQAARENGEGLVTYYWEVMDDSLAIELKHAYAKDFQPWGWVLGTGVYMVDVRQEIGRITRDATFAGVGILLLVTAVALYFSWRSHMAERNRLLAADALRKSEEQYRALTENSLDTIMRFDRDFRHTYVNKMVAVQTGIPVSDWIGKTHEELGFPEELNRLWVGTLARVFETGEVQRVEFMLPNGLWIDWLCVPELDAKGQVQGAVTTARDITERKRVEVELVASRRMLHEVINTIPVRVYWKGLDHCYLGCNRLFARDAGHAEPETLVGKDDFALGWAGSDKAHPEEDRRVLEHGAAVLNIERHHVTGDREVWLRMSKVPLLDDAGRIYGLLGTYDDITESKRMQEMMVETEKMMSVGGIAAGIAHEINNPLGIVLQAVQNLEQRTRADFRKNQEAAATIGLDLGLLAEYMRVRKLDVFMEDIQAAALRAAAIIRHMLDFTRRSESRRDVCDLAGIVEKALALAQSDYNLKKSYDFKRIQVNQDISTDLPTVSCTATEMEQVVLNLLRNAAQAMAESVPPVETPRIDIRIAAIPDGVRLELSDNGLGISPEIQARIFEPFFTTKPPGQGTGLGLSVSYFIVTKGHKGRMWVESRPGGGAKFVVELPSSSNEAMA
jgi:PAS domain S-box-containing protein